MSELSSMGLKQWAIFGRPFGGSLENPSLDDYCRIKYDHDGRSIKEAANSINKTALDLMQTVKSNNPDNTKFGVPVSGGLDSRLILYYADQLDMDITTYHFGYPRNKLGLKTVDYQSAQKLCANIGVPAPTTVPFQTTPNETLIEEEINRGILPNYHIWRYHSQTENIPEFDFNLTGYMCGEHFGQPLPEDALSLSHEEMVDQIMAAGGSVEPIPGIIDEHEYEQLCDNIYEFVREFDSPISAFQSFKLGHYTDSYQFPDSISIFTHDSIFEEVQTWKPEWLINQRLRKVHFEQLPDEISHVPNEADPPLHREGRFWKIYYHFFRKQIRGRSLQHQRPVKSPDFVSFADSVLSKENDIFDRYFNPDQILDYIRQKKYIGHGAPATNMIVIKKALDHYKATEG